ncbi:hypothetical protein HPB47_011461, partial [Ixodes persulcatus]
HGIGGSSPARPRALGHRRQAAQERAEEESGRRHARPLCGAPSGGGGPRRADDSCPPRVGAPLPASGAPLTQARGAPGGRGGPVCSGQAGHVQRRGGGGQMCRLRPPRREPGKGPRPAIGCASVGTAVSSVSHTDGARLFDLGRSIKVSSGGIFPHSLRARAPPAGFSSSPHSLSQDAAAVCADAAVPVHARPSPPSPPRP